MINLRAVFQEEKSNEANEENIDNFFRKVYIEFGQRDRVLYSFLFKLKEEVLKEKNKIEVEKDEERECIKDFSLEEFELNRHHSNFNMSLLKSENHFIKNSTKIMNKLVFIPDKNQP